MGWGSSLWHGVVDYGINPYYGSAKSLLDGRDILRDKSIATNARENQQDAEAWARRAQDYNREVGKLNKMQKGERRDRNRALRQFDANADNSAFTNEVDRAYQTELENSLAGLDQQYRGQSQRQGLSAVKRGVRGGSNDIEQQSDLANAFQSQAIDATQNALQRRASALGSRKRSMSAFRRSILAGDPAEAQKYQAMAQNENNQADKDLRLQDFMSAFSQIRGNQADNMSRFYGGLANTGAKYVNSQYGGGY